MTATTPVTHSIGEYAKALLHIGIVVLTVLAVYLKSGPITATEYVNLAILLVTSIGVYWTGLLPDAKFQSILKVAVAGLGAGLAALNTFVIPGAVINTGAIITIVLAGLAAVGVGVIPNTAPTPTKPGNGGMTLNNTFVGAAATLTPLTPPVQLVTVPPIVTPPPAA